MLVLFFVNLLNGLHMASAAADALCDPNNNALFCVGVVADWCNANVVVCLLQEMQ